MKNVAPPNDLSFFSRLFHIPYIIQMIKLIRCEPNKDPTYPSPRFQLFQPIYKRNDESEPKESLLKRLIKTYKRDIIIGLAITFILSVLNLLVPQIIREFFSLMKLQTMEQAHINHATYITQKFVILQILRAFVSGHVTRACYELSLKVESSLSAELTCKALRINSECRSKLPDSQVYHLESVDLKMISKMFQQFWMILDIPLTLTVSAVLLFMESFTFGLVGIYWIVIMFFLQRWLSDQLGNCNKDKHSLIEQRSKFNYQIIQKIKQARIDHSQTILLEKNNGYFLMENKILQKFYHYQSLFEISLLLLPIIVALSISLYDHNEDVSFTIKQVYMLLTLLGICYRPLKNIKSMSLHAQDGLHSLKRIQIYLSLPENNRSRAKYIINDDRREPLLQIEKDTMTMHRRIANDKLITSAGFYSDRKVTLTKGERLVVLCKKGQGATNFIKSLLGEIYTVNGSIKLQGSLAYLPEVNFFSQQNIRKNIQFYDKSIQQEKIKEAYTLLGLDQDLKFRKGLNEAVEVAKFSESELKKIGLARVICSNRQVYILDTPFLGLGMEAVERLEKLLREKQQKGFMIVVAQNFLRFADQNDKIMIMSGGQIRQYGRYGDLIKIADSSIHSFHLAQNLALSDRISFLPIVREFQQKIKKILILRVMTQQRKRQQEEAKILNKLLVGIGRYSLKLKSESEIKRQVQKKQKKSQNTYLTYFNFFINQLPMAQWSFSLIIMLSIELLHVFIQYQIGRQYKKGGMAALGSFRTLMRYEFVLTCGLAFLIYLQYHVLCLTSSIIGNKIYEKSLTGVLNKHIKWYQQSHAPFIADKFNHDYEEIYTIIHHIFQIIKFVIVFITTLLLIDASYNVIAVITTIIVVYYYIMLHFIRRSEETLIRSYPQYKHNFIKVFDQIIEGGQMISIFNKEQQAFQKAKQGFISISSYKQAINSSKIVQGILCELTSCLIIALGLEYGTIIKIKQGQQNQALIAVSVMLLFNLSDVFKGLMQTIIKLQSFFRLKVISYIELINMEANPFESKQSITSSKKIVKFNIQFSQILINEKDDPIFQIYPLTLNIYEGEKIILYEQDNKLRNNLLLALTNNLQNFSMGKFNTDVIKIGSINLDQLTKQDMRKYFSVIMPDNFYFSGTIQENLKWKNPNYNQEQAMQLAYRLNLRKQIPDFQTVRLSSYIHFNQNLRELSKKLALMKAILKKSKVIILKDTPWIFGAIKITDLLREAKLNCTVIGITNDLAGCEGAERFIYLDKLKIVEDDQVEKLHTDELSLSGALLRSSNFQAQEFRHGRESASLDQVLRAEVFNRTLVKSIIDVSQQSSSIETEKL